MASRCLIVAIAVAACHGPAPHLHAPLRPATTLAEYGDRAVEALLQDLYAGDGRWQACDGGCVSHNRDWGDDSLTYVLYLRWLTTGDRSLRPTFAALASTAIRYEPCHGSGCDWSDVPAWDAIADLREHEVTGDPRALALARRAYARIRGSDAYARGACPDILYQHPFGGGGGLKTLETDSNLLKAALLLWRATGEPSFLDDARRGYAAARARFLDPELPLYTVYVFDDGRTCAPLPHRFFASVNGNLIWSGVALATATGETHFLDEAVATARAIDGSLADGTGIFVDLQAENDIVEPLVEAFYVLATERAVDFARAWLLRNADAAIRDARIADGLYGRFWNGPAPTAPITSWQTNGGLALAVVAAALDPTHVVAAGRDWAHAQIVAREITALPASLAFTGDAIAVYGTLGEDCCEAGHARVLIDGRETVDQTGIWQNKSSAERSFTDTLLFAWRWASPGPHTVTFVAPPVNAKEGGPFLHITKYVVR